PSRAGHTPTSGTPGAPRTRVLPGGHESVVSSHPAGCVGHLDRESHSGAWMKSEGESARIGPQRRLPRVFVMIKDVVFPFTVALSIRSSGGCAAHPAVSPRATTCRWPRRRKAAWVPLKIAWVAGVDLTPGQGPPSAHGSPSGP